MNQEHPTPDEVLDHYETLSGQHCTAETLASALRRVISQRDTLAEALRKKEEELLAAYRVIDTARDVLAGRPIPEIGNCILALVCSGPERDALQQAVDAFVALKAAGVEP